MSTSQVWKLLSDLEGKKGITEIVINGPKEIFVERSGQFIQLDVNFSKNDIISFAKEIADYNKKTLSKENPIIDGNLPDGSRVNIVDQSISIASPSVTIRKYLHHIKSFQQSPDVFGLDKKLIELLQSMVSSKMNIIISGGTGVGKTTFMNLLLNEISKAERVIILEDTKELSIDNKNTVRLIKNSDSKVEMSDLVKNTLRMRPDRIILGEVRGGECFHLLQAMNTGHNGSLCSLHSNSAGECISRLENLYLMAGHDLPYQVVRKQMSLAIDFIVQLGRNSDGERCLTQISEVTGFESNNILMQDIVVLDEGKLSLTGLTPAKVSQLERLGGLSRNYFNIE